MRTSSTFQLCKSSSIISQTHQKSFQKLLISSYPSCTPFYWSGIILQITTHHQELWSWFVKFAMQSLNNAVPQLMAIEFLKQSKMKSPKMLIKNLALLLTFVPSLKILILNIKLNQRINGKFPQMLFLFVLIPLANVARISCILQVQSNSSESSKRLRLETQKEKLWLHQLIKFSKNSIKLLKISWQLSMIFLTLSAENSTMTFSNSVNEQKNLNVVSHQF